jgi:hypothetical protein
MGVYLHFRLYAVATLLFSNRRVLKMMMNMGRKDLSGNRKNTVMMSLLFLALLISFVGGCAAFKCGKKEPLPTPQSPPEAVMGDCEGSCPAPASLAPTTVSVTGSESAPDGSVVSGEEVPQADPQGMPPPAPPTTEGSTTSQYLNQEEIIRNPNGTEVSTEISPAGYQETTPTPVPQTDPMPLSDIPSGYSGLTQSAQNQGVFQNVSQEATPGRSRIKFQTVIEE